MIAEVADMLDEMLEQSPTLVIDNWELSNGLYVLVSLDNLKILDVLNVQRKPSKDSSKEENNFQVYACYPLIKKLDYYSRLVSMNKAVASKKVQSSHYLAFAVKKETVSINKDDWDKAAESYYSTLKNPYTADKEIAKMKKALYDKFKEEHGEVDQKAIERIESWVKAKTFLQDERVDIESNPQKEEYIKIFFIFEDQAKTLKEHQKESERYLLPNLYCKNDYNIYLGDDLYGLPAEDISDNEKKPYEKNRSQKTTVLTLILQQDALKRKQLFEYFDGCIMKQKNNIYVDFDQRTIHALGDTDPPDEEILSGAYFRLDMKNGKAYVQSYDNITSYRSSLNVPFTLCHFVDTESDDLGSYLKLYKVERLVSKTFFSSRLEKNYHSELSQVSKMDPVVKSSLLTIRQALFGWFRKGDSRGVELLLEPGLIPLIDHSAEQGALYKARDRLNLLLSLKEYFSNKGVEEKMNRVRSSLRGHIIDLQGEWDFLSDDEYYYALGQAAVYLQGKSKASKKTMSAITQLAHLGTCTLVKINLMRMYDKYAQEIGLGVNRINILIGKILSYQPSSERTDYLTFMAGALSRNLLYTKNEEESA